MTELQKMEMGRAYRLGNLWVSVSKGGRGARKDLDRIIWVATGAPSADPVDLHWTPIAMESVAGLAALIAQNEATIWPEPRYTGARMWRNMLGIALESGLGAARRWKASTHGKPANLETRCVCGNGEET